jgi:hypothetical protein
MRKTIFFCNFASSIVILTLSTILWFSDDAYYMTGSPLHFLMTVVGSIVFSWCLFELRDIHHADEIFADSIDDHEWGALECMLKNYRRYYETELKNSPMYESGMRDIDGWLHYVEEFRK